MTEVATSLLAFFSIGILAVHAFDAFANGVRPPFADQAPNRKQTQAVALLERKARQ